MTHVEESILGEGPPRPGTPEEAVLMVPRLTGRAPVFTRPSATDPDGPGLTFESSEHLFLGNHVKLNFDAGPVDPVDHPLPLPNGLSLTYGKIIALAGDFYGLPDDPVSQSKDPLRSFEQAFNTLARDNCAEEVGAIFSIMQKEIDAVNEAIRNGQEPSTAYAALGDSLSAQWNVVTGGGAIFPPWYPFGRYMQLAVKNFDHFGRDAVKTYETGHNLALSHAQTAFAAPNPAERLRHLELAYAINAFADHYLTDLFSSGHLRVPRVELNKHVVSIADVPIGSYLAKYMHDEDSCWGLQVWNTRRDGWKAYGDKRLLDSVNVPNLRLVQEALQTSVNEVYATSQTGKLPDYSRALILIPDLDRIQDTEQALRDGNPSPMFIAHGGTVDRRKDLADRRDFFWTNDWTAAGTLLELGRLPDASGCSNTSPPFVVMDQLIQIWAPTAEMSVFAPVLGGGFYLANSDQAVRPEGSQDVAWLSADLNGNAATELVQAYRMKDGRLGMMVYEQLVPHGYGWVWRNDAFGPAADGAWMVAPGGTHGDVIARIRVASRTVEFDVYSWDPAAKAMIRAGGLLPEPPFPAQAQIHRWIAMPSGGRLPELIAMQAVGSNRFQLVRYVPDASGKYRRLTASDMARTGHVPVLNTGRTVANGPIDLISYESSAETGTKTVSIYRVSELHGAFELVNTSPVPRLPGPSEGQPMFAGDLTGNRLADLVCLCVSDLNYFAAVTYSPVNGKYQETWRTDRLGVLYRNVCSWVPITGGADGRLAMVNTWAEDGAGIALFTPNTRGGIELTWMNQKVGPGPFLGTWLAGRLPASPSSTAEQANATSPCGCI